MIPAWLNLDWSFADVSERVQPSVGAAEIWEGPSQEEPAAASPAHRERIDEQLVVEWRHKSVSIEKRRAVDLEGREVEVETTILRFAGGVKADYGPTHLEADELELQLDDLERAGYARGNVRLMDPEGEATADALDFQWRAGTAHASNAYVRVGSLGIRAGEIHVTPSNWILTDAALDPNVGGLQVYTLSAPVVDVRPGSKGIVRKLDVKLFGTRLFVIPRLAFSLRQGSRGVRLPGVSLREGGRPGLTWDSDFELGNRMLLSTGAAFIAQRKPSGSLTLAYDLLGPESNGVLFEPHSDLADPFHNGYFDNIAIKTPERERKSVGATRAVVAASGSYFQRVSGREALTNASKPWELVLDVGRTSSGIAQNLQLRYQEIEELPGQSLQRATAIGALTAPSWSLARGLESSLRLDGRAFLNPKSDYGWARATAGLTYLPASNLRLGASYAVAGEYGGPAFQFDRPWPLHSANLRADLTLGPRSLSAMFKYDPARHKWYDREFALYQVAGSFSLYAVWRQFPSRFSLGFELRTLDVIERLKTRVMRRTKGGTEARGQR